MLNHAEYDAFGFGTVDAIDLLDLLDHGAPDMTSGSGERSLAHASSLFGVDRRQQRRATMSGIIGSAS